MIQADAELSPLLHRTMHILLMVLHLRLPAAWKILQLSVVMLWNAAVQSREYSIAASHCLAVIQGKSMVVRLLLSIMTLPWRRLWML
jgi:hypothetical protein